VKTSAQSVQPSRKESLAKEHTLVPVCRVLPQRLYGKLFDAFLETPDYCDGKTALQVSGPLLCVQPEGVAASL